MLSKVLILLVLLAIVYSLASALILLIRDKGESERTVWRLTWRISLSLLLFAGIYAAIRLGYIEPGNSGPIRYAAPPGPVDTNP